MLIIKNIGSLQKKLDNLKKNNNEISLVPTMGSLHEGHISLVKKAKRGKRIVVVSIFINTTQFGANEDFNKYPKNTNKDSANRFSRPRTAQRTVLLLSQSSRVVPSG